MNITAVAIVAICCWAVVELVNGKKNKKPPQGPSKEQEHMSQEITQLKERVATLEKIVTDEKYDLKRQFETL